MEVYENINAFQGLKPNTMLYGVYPLVASSIGGYFTKEDIPMPGTPGEHGWFKTSVENNPLIFKLLPNGKTPA